MTPQLEFLNPLTIIGGTLAGSRDVRLNAGLNWSGGTISGSGRLFDGGLATSNVIGHVTLDARKWNPIRVNQTGSSRVTFANGGVIENNLWWDMSTTDPSPLTGVGTFNNGPGTQARFTRRATDAQDISVHFINGGTMDVGAGPLTLESLENEAASRLIFSGNVTVNGNLGAHATTLTGGGVLTSKAQTTVRQGGIVVDGVTWNNEGVVQQAVSR